MTENTVPTNEAWNPYGVPESKTDVTDGDATCRFCGATTEQGLIPTHTVFYPVGSWLAQFLNAYTRLDGGSVWNFSLFHRYHPIQRCQQCQTVVVRTGIKLSMSEARESLGEQS